jgi:MoxR-like ATPase
MEENPLILRLKEARKEINRHVFERRAETDAIIITILAGSSCLFVGDVGTAKTSHITYASKLFGLSVFDTLMSETTKPDSIFGPADIPALAKGIQRVKIKDYAADCEIVFFDELFKANGIVLNPLLWLINERIYRNGDEGIIQTPLKAVFAASNEIPTDSTMRAIYDRLMLRFEVDYIKVRKNLHRMVNAKLVQLEKKVEPKFTSQEIEELMKLTTTVHVPEEIRETVFNIREQIEQACSIKISDRRVANSFPIIQAKALMNGRLEATQEDAEIVANIFWDKPEQHMKTSAIAMSYSSGNASDLISYSEMADSVLETAFETGDMKKALRKLKSIYNTTVVFTSRTGIMISEQVRDKIVRVRKILNQRKNFSIVKIITEDEIWYKLSAEQADVWTKSQLRSCGFHWRRNKSYWEHDGPKIRINSKVHSRKLKRTIMEQLGVECKIKILKG